MVSTPGAGKYILICNQPMQSTQPGHPSVGRHNECQAVGSDAVQGVKAGVAGVW